MSVSQSALSRVFVFSVSLTPDDLAVAVHLMPQPRTSVVINLVITLFAIFFLMLIVRPNTHEEMLACIAYAIVLLSFSYFIMRLFRPVKLRDFFYRVYPKESTIWREKTYIVSRTGITLYGQNSYQSLSWGEISKIITSAHYTWLETGVTHIIIPHRYLPTDVTPELFQYCIRTFMARRI